MDLEWPMGMIPITKKELKEFQEEVDKLEAIKKRIVAYDLDCIGLRGEKLSTLDLDLIFDIKKILEG